MKRLFSMIIFLILSMSLILYSADKVEIVKSINLRAGPSVESDILTYAIPKDVYIICDEKVGLYYVSIKSGSSHKGETGYIYSSMLVVREGGEAVVLGKGCRLRQKPTMDNSEKIVFIKDGAVVTIIKCVIRWYGIERKFNSKYSKVWLCNLPGYIKVE